jgi:hypothetical protein
VNGARQSGKITLVRLVGAGVDAEWYSFDDTDVREAAREDPRDTSRLRTFCLPDLVRWTVGASR